MEHNNWSTKKQKNVEQYVIECLHKKVLSVKTVIETIFSLVSALESLHKSNKRIIIKHLVDGETTYWYNIR